MSFLSPLNLLWLPPICGLIVVMYILKLRRKDVVVSSTFLWRQVIRDVQANAPFQKLRRNLLLLLQLIIACLLIFALAQPFLRLFSVGGRSIVIVVDTSASMMATDVAPSRLEAARQEARRIVDGMRPGDVMMVLGAASKPQTATGFTDERAELRRAIDSLTPRQTPTNMRDALNLAADLVASRNSGDTGRIELISDGSFEGSESVKAGGAAGADSGGSYGLASLNLGKTHLAFHPIGTGRDNVGITAVDFRRNLGADRSVQLLVVTRNFGDRAHTFNEEIYAEDNLVEAHEVTLPPGGEDTQPYNLPEPERALKMRVRLDVQDSLSVDNEAALILKPRKTLRVLLVGKENLFLENALKVDSGIDLSRTETFTTGAGFDVVIFDEAAPAHLPEGNYLFLHCVSDQAPVSVSGAASNVSVADSDREHPVLRYVDWGSDRFGTALQATPLGWGREIAVGESGSLIVVGEKNKMRAEFVAMSLKESLFYERVAFPIFIANSARWLGTGGDDSEQSQIRSGDPLTIAAPPSAGRLTVTRPDGSKREVATGERGGAVFDEADLVGLYQVTGAGFSAPYAANLASASESDITPHKTLSVLDGGVSAPGRRVESKRPLLPLLALLALLVLAGEWYVFHRRVSAT